MSSIKFLILEKHSVLRLCYLLFILFAVMVMINCKKSEYNDGFEKGLKKGKKIGFVLGYEKAKEEWYKRGANDGYLKGSSDNSKGVASTWFNKGVNEGYEIGLKKGKKEGYKDGTKVFVKKWWKPSLGLIILLLISVFVFFTIFLLIRKHLKRFAEKTVKAVEDFRVSIKMERILKNGPKK